MVETASSDEAVVHTVPLLVESAAEVLPELELDDSAVEDIIRELLADDSEADGVDELPPDARAIPVALADVTVTVRDDGAIVYAMPRADADRLGELSPGAQRDVLNVQFENDGAWLQIAWSSGGDEDTAWIADEDTDFARSSAFDQVVDRWYEADSVLGIRRTLVQDLMRVKEASDEEIASVDSADGDDLAALEASLAQNAVVAGYRAFRALGEHLGLPDPFEYLPVQPMPPAAISAMAIDGFGPTVNAEAHGDVYYYETRGMSPGMEYSVPEGSPLIAVADGEIVDFTFLEHPAARSLALRPYLPAQFRAADGSRVLSNVVVAYGHLMGDPPSDIAQPGDVVRAGQVIGTSGWPVYTRSDGSVGVQGNNAHLHLETHLVTDGTGLMGDDMPINPILFWIPRLVALQARLSTQTGQRPYPRRHTRYGRLGFFTLGAFRTDFTDSVWNATAADPLWPEGVYTLDALLAWARALPAYPVDGSSTT